MQKVTIPVSRGLYQVRGLLAQLLVRSGLVLAPLAAVITLCVLMFSLRGKAPADAATLPAPDETLPGIAAEPLEQTGFTRAKAVQGSGAQAAFEQLHILHARINVPQ